MSEAPAQVVVLADRRDETLLRRKSATYRAMLDDTAELIDMVVARREVTEEDREALVFQAQAIRTVLGAP